MITIFIQYYNSKLTFIMDKVKRKFEKKLSAIHFKRYKCEIDKDRYRIDLPEFNEEVNLRNNNIQFRDPVESTTKDDKWRVNVSGVEIPTYVKDILKLGEKFNFNSSFDDRLAINYVKNFETFVKNYPEKAKIQKIRGTFLNVIKNRC